MNQQIKKEWNTATNYGKSRMNVFLFERTVLKILKDERINREMEKLNSNIIKDVNRANEIIDMVCNLYNVTIEMIKSNRRFRHIVEPRQLAIYLIRKQTLLTIEHIGLIFGGKNHATVIYAVRTMSNLLETKQVKVDLSMFNHN